MKNPFSELNDIKTIVFEGRPLNYTNAIDNNIAIMLLYGPIDSRDEFGRGVLSDRFCEEMMWHNRGGRDILIKINSPGGSVFGGMAIIDAVRDCNASTHIAGLAASMAMIIAPFGKKATANDFAIGMLHGPSGSGAGAEEVLKHCKQSLSMILKNRTTLTEDQIGDVMKLTGQKGTWMNADRMLEIGLITSKINTGKKISIKATAAIENVNETYKIYCQLNNAKEMELSNLITALGLAATADDALVIQAISELKTKNANLAQQVVAQSTELTTLRDEAKTLRSGRAETLVSAAITAKKIKSESKQDWIDAAMENFERTSKQLDAIASVAGQMTVTSITDTGATNRTAHDASKTYEWYMENDVAGLDRIADENPALYEKIVAEFTKRNKK